MGGCRGSPGLGVFVGGVLGGLIRGVVIWGAGGEGADGRRRRHRMRAAQDARALRIPRYSHRKFFFFGLLRVCFIPLLAVKFELFLGF